MHHISKKKLNWIDVSILIAVFAVLISLLLRSGMIANLWKSSQAQEVKITFLASALPNASAEQLQLGDECTLADTVLGPLAKKEASAATLYLPNAQGILERCASETHTDLRCVLLAKGVQTEQGFYLNNKKYLAPGQKLSISTENLTFEILILDIAS